MKRQLTAQDFKKFDFFKPYWGIECDDGWFELIYNLCSNIEAVILKYNIKDFAIIQVKEKFGGIRIYCRGLTNQIDPLIRAAESISENTCEDCGAPGKIRNISGLLKALCDEHYSMQKQMRDNEKTD